MTESSPMRVFRWPAVFAAATLTGLLSALIGDGPWDGLSWVMLAWPAGTGLVLSRRRS